MIKSHLNILIPQWQGGGQDLSTYEGGLEIKNNYFRGLELTEAEVETEKIEDTRNNIFGYDAILKQLKNAKARIAENRPKTIFTIGGGCDADVTSMSYLNSLAAGDMTLLYFDAHGDMNTPESSGSKCFYGMSLRTLLGDGDRRFIDSLFSTLSPSQIIMLGVRDLDKAEADYIKDKSVNVLTVDEIEKDTENVINSVREKGSGNIYIHIDLDVLDPEEFPFVPVPVQGGLGNDTLIKLLKRLSEEFTVCGLGILEYSPSGGEENSVVREIVDMGRNL